jgi:hypothetical protein
MANDRETKSFEVKPQEPPEASAVRTGGDPMMARGKNADLRAHGESGSSGVGLPPQPDYDAHIHTRDGGDDDQ